MIVNVNERSVEVRERDQNLERKWHDMTFVRAADTHALIVIVGSFYLIFFPLFSHFVCFRESDTKPCTFHRARESGFHFSTCKAGIIKILILLLPELQREEGRKGKKKQYQSRLIFNT